MKGKIILLSFLLFFVLISQVFSQNFWEQLYFPDSVNLQCIDTDNSGNIFVGTLTNNSNNGVYRSSDGGNTWECVFDNDHFAVLSLGINDLGNVYVGKNGFERFIVLKDNCQVWDTITIPPPSYGNIIKILCIGNDTLLVSSWEDEGSLIMISTDSGQSWESSFVTDHQNEYVSDIAVNGNGDIYVSCDGFFVGQGGVYKSENFGDTWEYVGLLNHQVMTIEINSNNDVFTGDWWIMNNDTPGIYALYEGNTTFQLVLDAYHATDIVITSENVIYATAHEDVVRSFDDGQTWEIIEDVLSPNTEFLQICSTGYLYGTRFDRIIKSKTPITGIGTDITANSIKNLKTYPNPANDVINVRLPENTNNSTGEIYIYKLSGELVRRIDISKTHLTEFKNCLQLNVSNLSCGVYPIKCSIGNETFASKFIKK